MSHKLLTVTVRINHVHCKKTQGICFKLHRNIISVPLVISTQLKSKLFTIENQTFKGITLSLLHRHRGWPPGHRRHMAVVYLLCDFDGKMPMSLSANLISGNVRTLLFPVCCTNRSHSSLKHDHTISILSLGIVSHRRADGRTRCFFQSPVHARMHALPCTRPLLE